MCVSLPNWTFWLVSFRGYSEMITFLLFFGEVSLWILLISELKLGYSKNLKRNVFTFLLFEKTKSKAFSKNFTKHKRHKPLFFFKKNSFINLPPESSRNIHKINLNLLVEGLLFTINLIKKPLTVNYNSKKKCHPFQAIIVIFNYSVFNSTDLRFHNLI